MPKPKQQKNSVAQKVAHWFEILEPLNKKPKLSEKLIAHVELKTFVEEFITNEE